MNNLYIKCYECGHEANINHARNKWIWTRRGHVYCTSCVIKLFRKIKKEQKNAIDRKTKNSN